MKEHCRALVTTVYRAHHPRWAHRPESGAGAALHGGRFNRPGVECLYTSLAPETAWLEAQQAFPFKAQPMTLCAYEVDCDDVLDLTDAAVRDALAITLDDLACAWEDEADRGIAPPTWRFADDARAAGATGIVVPSFANRAGARDGNAVFWRWSEERPHRVRVIDDFGRLPRSEASWRKE